MQKSEYLSSRIIQKNFRKKWLSFQRDQFARIDAIIDIRRQDGGRRSNRRSFQRTRQRW